MTNSINTDVFPQTKLFVIKKTTSMQNVHSPWYFMSKKSWTSLYIKLLYKMTSWTYSTYIIRQLRKRCGRVKQIRFFSYIWSCCYFKSMPYEDKISWFTPRARTVFWATIWYKHTMVHKDTNYICRVHTRPRPVKLKIYLRNPCGESVSEQGEGDNSYQGRSQYSQQRGGRPLEANFLKSNLIASLQTGWNFN